MQGGASNVVFAHQYHILKAVHPGPREFGTMAAIPKNCEAEESLTNNNSMGKMREAFSIKFFRNN